MEIMIDDVIYTRVLGEDQPFNACYGCAADHDPWLCLELGDCYFQGKKHVYVKKEGNES